MAAIEKSMQEKAQRDTKTQGTISNINEAVEAFNNSEAPKVRLRLNLDVTAPLILVPSSLPGDIQNNPIIILDLGHLVVTHDTGPPEEIVDYTYFYVQLEHIGAYVQNSDKAPLPLGAIIKPFSINLDIGTKHTLPEVPKLELPATTIKGKLDKLNVCVTTEKVKDILRVVTSIQPPPPKKDEEEAAHQKRLLKMQRRGNRLTESVGSLTAQVAADWSRLSLTPTNSVSSLAPKRGPKLQKRESISEIAEEELTAVTREETLALEFSLGRVTVMVRDKPEEGLPEGHTLVKAKVAELQMDVKVSNWDTNANLTLDRCV